MVKQSSETILTSFSSTPPESILRTNIIIAMPAMISRTLMAMEMKAAFLTFTWSFSSSLVKLNFIFLRAGGKTFLASH